MWKRTAWSSVLAMTMFILWVAPAPSAAQAPVAATMRPASAMAPSSEADLPPSTVSPSIARFMKEHGAELPPEATAPRTPGRQRVATAGERSAQPSAPGVSRVSQVVQDRPPAIAPLLPPRDERPASVAPGTVASSPVASSLNLNLKPAPLEPTDFRFPINLATALRLSDARPLMVAYAQAGVWVAEAQLLRAKVIWVPTVNIGFDYIRHEGGGPDFNKGIMTAPSVNYFMGGAGAALYVNLTDAIYKPLAARQVLNSRHFDIQSAKNDVLFQTAEAYFRVHQARGTYAGALYAVERGHDLIERVLQLSKELVPKDEVDRARNMVADLEQRAVFARQEWRVASADLTQTLRLDPRAVVEPLEHDHVQITLVDPARSFDDLMPIALTNRPEIGSRAALVQAAEINVRQEKARPFVPIVMVNGFQHAAMYLQLGVFGIGSNSSLSQFEGRADVSTQLVWQLENFGFGNLGRIKQQRGLESKAIIDLRNMQDAVAADVNRALSRVQSAAARVTQADRALRTAIITFNGHLEGLGQTRRLENLLVLTFRPQEAVYSLEQLNVSFNEYFTTVAEYNRAQFDLFHALGYPAHEVAALRTPGEVIPVDTARPGFLPPVGNGPPSATR